jgi:hypothetical protein
MFKPFRSMTRLIIGGMALGYDGLQNRMKAWEQQVSQRGDFSESGPEQETVSPGIIPSPSREDERGSFGYLLVGLNYKMQKQLEGRLRNAEGFSHSIGNLAKYIWKPIYSNRAISPIRNRFDDLVERGQREVEQWIEIGQKETDHSRVLVQTAIQERMDRSIQYLANDPQVEELVTLQSASLIDEMIEEIRERTVSADDFIEGIIRAALRFPLRSELPPPPPELKKHAISFRVVKGRTIYK